MQPEPMVATLKSLKLFGMAQAIDDRIPGLTRLSECAEHSWQAPQG